MNKSESIIKLAPAWLAAQRKITSALKEAKNPFFKSSYASLESVIEACKQHLNDHDISVLQPVGSDEQGNYVETVLLHSSGEWVSSKMHLILTKNDMQSAGSGISYARRYSLQSLVFLGAQDDDGEASMGRKTEQQVVSLVPKEESAKRANGFKPTQKAEIKENSDW